MQFKYLFSLFFVLFQLLTIYAAPVNEKRTSGGSIPAKYVRYNTFFMKPKNWGETVWAYIYTDNKEVLDDEIVGTDLLEWPGTELFHSDQFEYTDNLYYYNFPVAYYGSDCYIIFTDGKNQAPGVMQQGFLLEKAFQVFTEEGCVGEPRELLYNRKDGRFHYEKPIKIIYKPKLENTSVEILEKQDMYAHYRMGGRDWTKVPGEKMYVETDANGNGYYAQYFLAYEDEEELSVVFTNGKDVWDNNNGKNYVYRTALVDKIEIKSD
eukprot:jgi/Orpsp1_1/1179163/evm.model.c7180000068241.1